MSRKRTAIKSKKGIFYLSYTIVFCALCMIVFSAFILNDKTFVWKFDGMNQHYRALFYYGKYLRGVIRNLLFNHSLDIPTYSAYVGYGGDIIATFSYYVIGDPIAALSVFVPSKYMIYFYNGAVILRMYLAGITFAAYCFYRKHSENAEMKINNYGIFAGTMMYVFCGYVLYAAMRHPYFTNPMIYFPIVLLGVEKIIDGKKPYTFAIGVFLASISNFYFFYMIVMLTVLYVPVRLINTYGIRQIKKIILKILYIAVYAILGTGMSSVILLPTIKFMLQSARGDAGIIYDPFYIRQEYMTFFRDLITAKSGVNWRYIGISAIAVLAITLLFLKKKKNRDLKFIFIVLTIGILTPAFNSFMNGLSYVVSRWSWGYVFFMAFIVVAMWQEMQEMNAREIKIVAIVSALYTVLCFIEPDSRKTATFFALATAFLAFALMVYAKDEMASVRKMQVALIAVVLLNIAGVAVIKYSPYSDKYIAEYLSYQDVKRNMTHNEERALKKYISKEDKDLYRYQGSITRNSGIETGYKSTQYFWSLADGNITKFQKLMNLTTTISFNYSGLNQRAYLAALANAKYNVGSAGRQYGYKKLGSTRNYKNIYSYLKDYYGLDYKKGDLDKKEIKKVQSQLKRYDIWENTNVLPFGYTYSNAISESDFEKYPVVNRQEAMMQAVVLDTDETLEKSEITYENKSVPYKMECKYGARYEDGKFYADKKNSVVFLTFEGLPDSETYLKIQNLEFTPANPREGYTDFEWKLLSKYKQNKILYQESNFVPANAVDVIFRSYTKDKKGVKKRLDYKTQYQSFYSGAKDFLINFEYGKEPKTKIKITLTKTGVYTFDDLEVVCQPMKNFTAQTKELAKDSLQNVDFHEDTVFHATNRITGDIELKEPKYLVLSIPYSDGWSVYVDGEKTESYKANIMFTGIKLDAGHHDIVLKYKTPFLNLGILGSVLCTIILIITAIFNRKKQRRDKEK